MIFWYFDLKVCNQLYYTNEKLDSIIFNQIEKYLSEVTNRFHKNALTRLRISAHRLHIETGRHRRYEKELKAYVNTPKEERKCCTCPEEIEDEYHFLFRCTRNHNLRRIFYKEVSKKHTTFSESNEKEKIKILFDCTDTETIKKFAKFVYQSFHIKSKRTGFDKCESNI